MPKVEFWYSASKLATVEGYPPAKGSKVVAGAEEFEVREVEWYLDTTPVEDAPAGTVHLEGLKVIVSLDKLPEGGNEQS